MKNTAIITDNKVFLNLYKRGKYAAGKAVTVYYKKNPKGQTRLGITTGKKVGSAVVRSRCRRIIRAAYSMCENDFPKGYDYIIVARSGCGEMKSTSIAGFFRMKAIPSIVNNGAITNNGAVAKSARKT